MEHCPGKLRSSHRVTEKTEVTLVSSIVKIPGEFLKYTVGLKAR